MISSISRTHAVVMHTRALMTAREVVPTGNMLVHTGVPNSMACQCSDVKPHCALPHYRSWSTRPGAAC